MEKFKQNNDLLKQKRPGTLSFAGLLPEWSQNLVSSFVQVGDFYFED